MTDSVSTSTQRGSIEIPHPCSCLSTSRPATETCITIQSLVEEHERRLVTIQDQVERLRTCLAHMEHHHVQTKDAFAKLHARLAPIERLPPEILSEIFEWCLDASDSSMLFMTARNKEAPLFLGHVCRSWRAIAHATPRLWRHIFVNVCNGGHWDELRRDAFPVLQTWLANSGSLPLNLVLLCKAERVLPGLTNLFETIAAHAARWQTVQVRLQNSPVIYGLVCRTFSKCTSLSTFDVTDGGQCTSYFPNHRQGEVVEMQKVRFDLSSAPLGRLSLSLAGLAIRDVHAPWATLTRLSFMQDARTSMTSITDYVAILRQCMLLRECTITIDGGVRDAPLEPFTLPKLECVELRVLREANHTTQVGDFLSVLNAPRLCTLAIEDYCRRREAVVYHSELKTFLQAHARSLRHLRYSTTSKFFTAENLMELIAETPLLTELEYVPDEESSPKALLQALTPRVEGDVVECLLPRLERFLVYWDTAETVSKVGDMIEKRYALAERGVAQLRYLSCKAVGISLVYGCVPPHAPVENLAARLEPLCRRGLQVDWSAYRYDLEFSLYSI